MNKKQAVEALNGSQRGAVGNQDLFKEMKASGLVAVFSCCDYGIEFCGAYNGGVQSDMVYFNKQGPIIDNLCQTAGCPCPLHKEGSELGTRVKARWIDKEGFIFTTFSTTLPYKKFKVFDGDEAYCVGLVFSLHDCKDS